MSRQVDRPLIVLATDSAVPSGVGEHMLTLARALSGAHRVVLSFPPTTAGAAFLRRADRMGLAVKPLGADEAFGDWLRETRPDVLHVHAGIGWEGHGLINAGWMAGVPILRTEHLPYVLTDEAQRIEHRLSLGMVDSLVFVSDAAAETYRAAGVAGRQSKTIANGIDRPSQTAGRSEMRSSLGLDEASFAVLTVARFTTQKDHPLLLAAAEAVIRQQPRVRFLLVGDGPERDAVERMADERGVAHAISFLGERNDVPDLMAASDLFVLPSRFEGLPLALLEAMSVGLPAVATRIGGTTQALGDDYPWLVEIGDADTLTRFILAAIDDPPRRRQLADRNRARFDQHFQAERMGRETAELYQTVMTERMLAV